MKVYEIGDTSKGLALRMAERPVPTPGHGEVLYRIRATGLNARDMTLLLGLGRTPGPQDRIPLMDNAGEVAAVGPGVTRVAVGDRVVMTHYWRWLDGEWDVAMSRDDFAGTRDGFLAEYVVVPEAPLIKLPDDISFEQASTLQSAGLTAWNAVVEAGRARASDTVLTLGTGGVSVFGLQWAKMLGARVIITSSSDAKLERMKALGADVTINYRTTPDWAAAVMAATDGRGADIVLNTVGLSEMQACLMSCASGGRVMYIGANSVAADRKAPAPTSLSSLPNLIIKDLTIKGIVVGSRRMFEDLLTAMSRNRIAPVIDRVYAFDEAAEAVRYMQSGEKVGKVVIRVG
ncbi:MAG: NAD(P)-dependent alcohol dehydrogenase [Rhodospirillaceae bacterium]|nr:NAD(P)-dependent alcohol dehydrogenase [Rhodospirillaceae bacterium]